MFKKNNNLNKFIIKKGQNATINNHIIGFKSRCFK